jgi:cytochrome c-type biogenesis protein CcmE
LNKKYIIIGLIAIVLMTVAFLSFDDSKLEYSDFVKAQNSGKKVQVIGSWLKSKPSGYDESNNLFSFFMEDKSKNIAEINFYGIKPNNFDIAPMVVVKGKYDNGKFKASEILTKCPSKYESNMGSK